MIDTHSDSSQIVLQTISKRIGLPGFSKIAEHVQNSEAPAERSNYADSVAKQYPCHTKEATIVNFGYFLEQANDYTKADRTRVAENFKAKLAFWNIDEDTVSEIITAIRNEPTVKYAMEIQGDNLFPYTGADSLPEAADSFVANRHRFPFEARKTAARKLLAEASRLKVAFSRDTEVYLNKAAGYSLPDLDAIVSSLRKRAHDKRRSLDGIDKLTKAAEAFSKDESKLYDADNLDAFMKAIDAYDRITKVAADYATAGVPEEVIFSVAATEKHASEKTSTVKMTNGKTVNLSDDFFQKLSAADPKLASEIGGDKGKAVEILPTLPRPDADYICSVCG